MAELNKSPRVANVSFPFGSPVGNPEDTAKQLQVVMATLELLETLKEPGTIVELSFQWRN
ncbi:MAG: hypothetical protein ACQEQG_09660 [Bacillota bacterium]